MSTRPPPDAESGALIAQEQLLPFLLNPRSYPHRPRTVQLIQTHSSFVFIAPPLVYKIKKPVNFGFLDFSTLEKRRHYCEREVELNRRLCPGIYLGVVPISRTGSGFRFGDGGMAVEYAVQMRRLGPGGFLDQRVDQGRVQPGDLGRVTRVLRKFYQAQKPGPEIEAWGRVERLRISTDENFRQAQDFIGHTLPRPAFEAIRDFTQGTYRHHRNRFQARVRNGWIRDCHGDLHLDHIHLTQREVQIFDCIEFNDRFRYVDVANDAAFLAMDLDFHGRPDLSRRFVRRMAAALKDPGMEGLMDFYKCYRAFVRGKVESLHSLAHAAPPAEREEATRRAQRYFQLSLQYAAIGSHPEVLVVMGCIGSGKSTLARALAEVLGWTLLSSDTLRKQMAGLPLYERSPAETRSRLYSRSMGDRTYGRLFREGLASAREGHGVILDATFSHTDQRRRLQELCRAGRVAWRFIEVTAPDAVVRRRLKAREHSVGEVSDARLEDFVRLKRAYRPPVELPAAHLVRIRSVGNPESTLHGALRALVRNRLLRAP